MSVSRYGTFNCVLPPEGPKAYPFNLDFTKSNTKEIDMSGPITAEDISFVSGLYFDNRTNANDVNGKVASIGQTFRLPAGKCGYLPLLITQASQIDFDTPSAPGVYVQVIMVNFPVWPCVF